MPSLTDQSVYYADQGTIRLPLPTSLRDEWNTEYSVENLSLLTGMATNAVQQGSGSTAGVTAGLALADRATGGQLSKAATSQPAQVGLQSQGATLNPFLTVMFKQPSFKHHNMQWKLTPSNEQESLQLNQIINTFRSNMLPDKNSALGGSLLTYPNIVQAAISVNDGSYFTYVFKPAVVTNFTIDFTPSGQPSFFGSSQSPAPTEALLGLQMMEIEYWLSSDFGLLGRQVSASSIAQAIQNGIAGLF
jgi:hypothetical protein